MFKSLSVLPGKNIYSKCFRNTSSNIFTKRLSSNNNINKPTLISKKCKNEYSFFKISAITLASFGLLAVYEYKYILVDNEGLKFNIDKSKINVPPLEPTKDCLTYEQGIYKQSLKEEAVIKKKTKNLKMKRYINKLKQKNNLPYMKKLYYRIMILLSKIECESISSYNRFIKEPFMITSRTLELFFFILIPTIYHYNFSSSHSNFISKLIETIETRGGPTFIKLAQWASSRTDLFSQETCDQLGKLHSMNKSHPLETTLQLIPNEYGDVLIEGCDIEFKTDGNLIIKDEDQNKMLLGSGAIGQVYSLNNNSMAIKVIHPKVRSYISRDLTIMKSFGNLLNMIPTWEWLSIPEEIEQFSIFLKTQLDFRIESCNMIKFNDLFADNANVYFPDIYSSGRDYIVEELIDGVSLSDVLNLKQKLMKQKGYETIQFYFNDISNIFVQSFLDMIILKNFIHADLHPGNIIVTLDQNNEDFKNLIKDEEMSVEKFSNIFKNQKILLNYIDTGLTIQLTPKNRINFINLFEQLCNYDGVKIGNLLIDRSKTPHTVIHKDEFIAECDDMMKSVAKEEFTLGNFSIGALLSQMMSLVRKHHIKLESEFIGVIVGLFVLEGVSKRLDKDIKFFEEAMPKLAEFSIDYNNRKLLTDGDVNKWNMAKFIARIEYKQEFERLLQEMAPFQLN